MDRKKELKEMYKRMKPHMGIFIIQSKISNKYYLEATQNLRGKMNSVRFQLESGAFRTNEQLQKEWTKHGSQNFDICVLDNLEYDKDESKTDYSEELEIMKLIWQDKLTKENKQSW
jgi:hypothetical protein